MKRVQNDCVDCAMHCIGNACKYRNVVHYYCDKCGNEDTLYDVDGTELCKDCLLEAFPIVEGSEL